MKTLLTVLVLLFAALAAVGGWFGLQQKNLAADADAKVVAMQGQVDEAVAARGQLESEVVRLQTQLGAAKAASDIPGAPTVSVAAVDGLKAELEKKEREIAKLRVQPTGPADGARAAAPRDPNQPDVSREERRVQEMARMKAEEPQEYQEMIQRRVQMRVEMKQGLDDRLKFYKGIDLTGLPAETVARHQELLGNLQKMSATFAAAAANPEGQTNFGDMREQMMGMNEVMREQRGILMEDLAVDLGLKGDAAGELVETIEYIREMTSPPRPSGGGRGGPGGGRGGR